MGIWLQHLLVALIVLACASFVVWQTVRALSGKRSKAGGCCATGCAEPRPGQSNRVVFMPVEMLKRK